MACIDCNLNCFSCDEFEDKVSKEVSIEILKQIRKDIMSNPLKSNFSMSDKIANFIVAYVGTMWFFYFCIVMVTVPLVLPQTMPVIQYVSSGYLQLILLPLIMIATNIGDKAREAKSEREYRVLLISDRIDELMDEK